MREAKCVSCGKTDAQTARYRVARVGSLQEKLLCEPCANAELQSAPKASFRVARYLDPTVCSKCATDYGSSELPQVGGLPFCATCRDALYSRTLPKWLAATVVGLFALLTFGWFHGVKFFRTEKSLILAERLIDKKQYAAAIPPLETVLPAAPNCEKCILLFAKAEMLLGNPATAYKALQKHNNGRFENSALASEVTSIADRIAAANKKYNEAVELDRKHQWEDAARKMREASKQYPEQTQLAYAAESMEEGVPFEKQDYDGFLKLTEAHWNSGPQDFMRAGALASALACKYAVTGDPQFLARSEEMLQKAHELAQTPDELKVFTEYEERIRYRLKSREIIDTDEYNRRFRPQLAKEKQKDES
jgi:hypothetical protein